MNDSDKTRDALATQIEMPGMFNANDYLGQELETTRMPTASKIAIKNQHKTTRIHLKARKKNEIKMEHLAELLPQLPEEGWSYHVVSSGNFDFWTYVPHLISLGGYFDELYVSTWTMNRENVVEMLELYDDGKVGKINLLTGKYFKRRETAVFALILEGLLKRGQRYKAFANHTKIMLLGNKDHNIIVEGTANLTANPRVEQFIITHHTELYEFHRKWMEEMLDA